MDDYQNDCRSMREIQEERYWLLMKAFAELLRKNVSDETLNTLKFETGISAEDLERGMEMFFCLLRFWKIKNKHEL